MKDIRPRMILRMSVMWNLENRIRVLHVMNDGLMVAWLEQHHIILREVIKSNLVAILSQPEGTSFVG